MGLPPHVVGLSVWHPPNLLTWSQVTRVHRGPSEPHLLSTTVLPTAPTANLVLSLGSLDVFIGNTSDKAKTLETDESFELTVNSSGARLSAPNVYRFYLSPVLPFSRNFVLFL
jgi:hypothetical protein